MDKTISSLQNKWVKYLIQLREKSKLRKTDQQFLIEGKREIGLAVKGGYQLEQMFYCEEMIPDFSAWKTSLAMTYEPSWIAISKEVYEKLAMRSSTEGIIALAKAKQHNLSQLHLEKKNPLILIAEAPEKPGNIGALLRTADASGIDAVIIANPKSDLYNPNIIRTSIGCLFTVPVFTGENNEVLSFLKKNQIKSFAAVLDNDSKVYDEVSYSTPTAILVGTEADGLSSFGSIMPHKKL